MKSKKIVVYILGIIALIIIFTYTIGFPVKCHNIYNDLTVCDMNYFTNDTADSWFTFQIPKSWF